MSILDHLLSANFQRYLHSCSCICFRSKDIRLDSRMPQPTWPTFGCQHPSCNRSCFRSKDIKPDLRLPQPTWTTFGCKTTCPFRPALAACALLVVVEGLLHVHLCKFESVLELQEMQLSRKSAELCRLSLVVGGLLHVHLHVFQHVHNEKGIQSGIKSAACDCWFSLRASSCPPAYFSVY